MFSRSPFLCGDSLSLMECMDNDCYHAVVTDPPYASGGLTTAERKASPARKYLSSSRYLSFDNDTRDQSTHFLWSVMWMQEAIRITRHGGWLMVFSDWRQLPLTSDALQVAGWTWRAVVTWDKTEACRPHQGMFRNQSEFILIATRGSIGKEQDRPRVFPATVFRFEIQQALTVEDHLPFRYFECRITDQHTAQGTFPGTVRPHDGVYLTRLDRKVDSFQYLFAIDIGM